MKAIQKKERDLRSKVKYYRRLTKGSDKPMGQVKESVVRAYRMTKKIFKTEEPAPTIEKIILETEQELFKVQSRMHTKNIPIIW